MAKKYTYNEKKKAYITQIWDGTYNPDGSKHRKHLSSKKSSADLERKVAAFKEEVANNGIEKFSSSDFYSYALTWLETAKASREYNTKAMYENAIKKHLVALEGIPITEIRHTHFQSVINFQIDHPRTCQVIYITFKQIIKAAIKDKILGKESLDDICEGIALPKYSKPKKRPLNQIEKEALRNVELDDRKATFLFIIYGCGLRKEEALALTKDSFDWEEKTVSIKNVLIFKKEISEIKPYPKSDRGIRTVPIPDEIILKIRDFIDTSEGQIFKNTSGEPLTKSGYDKMWRSIIVSLNTAVGWPGKGEKIITGLTAHTFRHNYCTELCYQIPQISTKMIARLLGDTEKMVIEVYSHILEEKETPIEVVNTALKL